MNQCLKINTLAINYKKRPPAVTFFYNGGEGGI